MPSATFSEALRIADVLEPNDPDQSMKDAMAQYLLLQFREMNKTHHDLTLAGIRRTVDENPHYKLLADVLIRALDGSEASILLERLDDSEE